MLGKLNPFEKMRLNKEDKIWDAQELYPTSHRRRPARRFKILKGFKNSKLPKMKLI